MQQTLSTFDPSLYGLIGISGKQYTGKDLLASLIQKHWPQFQKIPLAYAIKALYAEQHDLTLTELEASKAEHRPGLIALGDWGRQQDPDYWLKQVIAVEGPKIISDVRLKREYDLLKASGALLIRLETDRALRAVRGQLVSENDRTECELDAISDWDIVLYNNATPEDLEQRLFMMPRNQTEGSIS